MAIDHYDANGLTHEELAGLAIRIRGEFEILTAEYVDIISILEFKFPELFPGFRLHVVRDSEVDFRAEADVPGNRIVVRQFVYDSACDGDADSRFTLAHEMAHFLLHKRFGTKLQQTILGYTDQVKNLSFKESTESQADAFAMHFLVHPVYAYKYRNDVVMLCQLTGCRINDAYKASVISKRQEMIPYISF